MNCLLAVFLCIINRYYAECVIGSRTLWVVSTDPWRRTPWMVGMLGEGTEGLSGRRLAGQLRQQSASSGLVRRLLNLYRNRILDLWASFFLWCNESNERRSIRLELAVI